MVVVWVIAEVLSEESVSETVQLSEDQEDVEATITQTQVDLQQEQVTFDPHLLPVHDEQGVVKEHSLLREIDAVVVIQSAFRGMLARKRVEMMRGERVVKPAITEVVTETLGGTVEVALAPKELSTRERKKMKKPKKGVQVH